MSTKKETPQRPRPDFEGQEKNLQPATENNIDQPNLNVKQICEALGPAQPQSNGSYNVHCPAHDDPNPSLNVKLDGEKILVRCYAGCSQGAVIQALKDRNLWPSGNDSKPNNRPLGIPDAWYGKPYVQHWLYRDTENKTIGVVARFSKDGDKDIVPFFKVNGQAWKAGGPSEPKPIYGARLLSQAPNLPVLVLEGEKTADAAQRLVGDSYVCISWQGGTGQVSKADWKQLSGRNVYIWPDTDNPGHKAAQTIKKLLSQYASIINPPGQVKEGWDLADAEAEGWTGQRVQEWIDNHTEQAEEPVITIITGSELANRTYPDNPVIDGLLDEKESLLICGQSGIGKSLLSLLLAISLGDPPLKGLWGKFHIHQPHKVLTIQSENSAKATNKRLKIMLENKPELMRGLDNVAFPEIYNDIRLVGALQETNFKDQLNKLIDVFQADVLMVDPLISYHGEDENDNAAMRRSLDCLTEIQDQTGVATIVTHHLGKSADKEFNKVFSGRGASAIGDWAANILTLGLDKTEGPEAIIQAIQHKSRNFEITPDFYLRRTKYLEFEMTQSPAGQREQEEEAAVIQALKNMPGHQAESQTQLADNILASTGWGQKRIRQAIRKAVTSEIITEIQNPSHKQRFCYVLSETGK